MPKSLQQVLNQINKLQEQANSIRAKEVAGVISRIQEAIRHYNLKPEDLFSSSGTRTSAAPKVKGKRSSGPKYQSDDGRTWSGVGKRPTWFVKAIEAGRSPEDLLITKGTGDSGKKPKPGRAAAGKRKAASKAASVGQPKYHDGEGKTWTGRGTRPGWFVSALAAGKTPEDLLISKS